MKKPIPEKGKMTINGHQMDWQMFRSEKPSVMGISQSRIYELNLYRDGTMTADYNRKWIRIPSQDDEESALCLTYLTERFGQEKSKGKRKEVENV